MRWVSCVALLVLIFLAGGVTGGAIAVVVARRPAFHGMRSVSQVRDRLTVKIAQELDMSNAQTDQVRGLVGERIVAIREIRRQFEPQLKIQAELLKESVASVLTDAEQQTRWEETFAKFYAGWFPEPAATQPAP